ncbi:MAG: DeoR/GlpR family DNA-binding transcription regulator [Spirochaetia bacterium]|nr:DeoR/GlpR family DNA-binding transcription regulator [Spirochaetia bacterium]
MGKEKSVEKILFAEERRNRLVEYINEKHRVTSQELCEAFSVSSATIRNDLRELGEKGFISRTHGGAVSKSQTRFETKIERRLSDNLEEKRTVSRLALSLVEDGDTILLDSGTTLYELAKILYERHNLTIVTNDLTIAGILENNENCEILLVGGMLRKGFHCTLGSRENSILKSISVDKAFMGANSFSAKRGASTPDIAHAEIKREMIQIASQVILLCDHTKLERDSFMNFASPENIDILITDSIDPELKRGYEDLDITVFSEL